MKRGGYICRWRSPKLAISTNLPLASLGLCLSIGIRLDVFGHLLTGTTHPLLKSSSPIDRALQLATDAIAALPAVWHLGTVGPISHRMVAPGATWSIPKRV